MLSINHRPSSLLIAVFVLAVTAALGCHDNPMSATESTALASTPPTDASSNAKNGMTEPFADAEAFFEFNTTDNDLGLQIFLDAEGWRQVMVSDPSKRKIVQMDTRGELSELGITELRFESAEPSPAEVLALFPPGDYTFHGKKVDGGKLLSVAELSHQFAPPPTIAPSGGEAVDPTNTTVSWNAPGAEEVEIIISGEGVDGNFDVTVPGSVTSLDVPPQFLEAGTEYKIEILALAENGNRTIVESTFVTTP